MSWGEKRLSHARTYAHATQTHAPGYKKQDVSMVVMVMCCKRTSQCAFSVVVAVGVITYNSLCREAASTWQKQTTVGEDAGRSCHSRVLVSGSGPSAVASAGDCVTHATAGAHVFQTWQIQQHMYARLRKCLQQLPAYPYPRRR